MEDELRGRTRRARRARRRGCRARRSHRERARLAVDRDLDRRHRRVALLVVGRVHDDLVEDLVQTGHLRARRAAITHAAERACGARAARAQRGTRARTKLMVLFTILPRSASRTHIGCVTCSIVPTARATRRPQRRATVGARRAIGAGARTVCVRAQQDVLELRLLLVDLLDRLATFRLRGLLGALERAARARGASTRCARGAARARTHRRVGRDVLGIHHLHSRVCAPLPLSWACSFDAQASTCGGR